MRIQLSIRIGLILSCFLPVMLSGRLHAQSTQKGIVLEYQGTDAKTPLANVAIAAQNAAATQSDAAGQFTLQFRTLHPGDNIQLRRVDRSGYEIMNREVIENLRIGNEANTSSIQIVMCSRQRLQELRDGYRSVAAQRYQKELERSQEELERLKTDNKVAIEDYNQRMDSLEAAYEEKLQNLESYIDKFARIDVSELDSIEQHILDLVQAGQFEEAIELYDQQNFPAKLAQSKADRQQLAEAKQQIADAEAKQKEQITKLYASIDRQVTLLLIAGGEENQQKVIQIRREAFLADTTYLLARLEYASKLQLMGYIQQAVTVLEQGLPIAANDIEKGKLHLSIASRYRSLNDFTTALHHTRCADSLLWVNREKDHRILTQSLPFLSMLYLNLLPYTEEAEQIPAFVQRIRENWDIDTTDPISLTMYKELLESLTDFDSQNENHEQALWDVREAIRVNELLKQSSKANGSIPYSVYAPAASIFAFEGQNEELRSSYRIVTQNITERYPKVHATYEVTAMCIAAYTTAEALIGAEFHKEADSLFQQIEQIGLLPIVAQKFGGAMDAAMGMYQIYYGQTLTMAGNYIEAEKRFEEGFKLLSNDEDNAPIIDFMKPSSYAKMEANRQNYAQAEKFYQEAIQAVLTAYDNQPDSWGCDNICHYYIGIADLYLAQGKGKAANQWLKKAEKYAKFELDRQLIKKRK